MEILILLVLFQLKHYYADFHIQTYQQVLSKGIYGNLIGLSHTFEHAIGSLVILLGFSLFHEIAITTILLATVVECVIHYHIDYVKIKYGTKNDKTPLFWQQYGLDQLGHQLTYIWVVYYILV